MAGNADTTDTALAACDTGTPGNASRCRRRPSVRWPRPKRAGKPPRPTPGPSPKEFQGPKGPEPTRYGDWENKGIASDF